VGLDAGKVNIITQIRENARNSESVSSPERRLIPPLGRWRWLWYVAPILVLSWLPYVVLKLMPRYRATERRVAEHERGQPHFVLRLTPTEQGEPLHGGFIRV
jgi:hypothetical protein